VLVGSDVWDSALIGRVVSALGLPGPAGDMRLSVLAGYPHIAELSTSAGIVVLKRIPAPGGRSGWFEDLYQALQPHSWAAAPRLTTAGTHTIPCGESVVIALDWLPGLVAKPTARWWATRLADLHSITWARGNSLPTNTIDHCDPSRAVDLMDAARHLLIADVHDALLRLLAELPVDGLSDDLTEAVLCHGDPNSSNVRGTGQLRLLDFDRSGFAFREYDAQRLLWFRAIEQPGDLRALTAFWHEFRLTYQEKTGYKLQDVRLCALNCIDVIKATAWLSLVAADPSRPDQHRQATLLASLVKVLRSGSLDMIFNDMC
jgi:hypothetical protein